MAVAILEGFTFTCLEGVQGNIYDPSNAFQTTVFQNFFGYRIIKIFQKNYLANLVNIIDFVILYSNPKNIFYIWHLCTSLQHKAMNELNCQESLNATFLLKAVVLVDYFLSEMESPAGICLPTSWHTTKYFIEELIRIKDFMNMAFLDLKNLSKDLHECSGEKSGSWLTTNWE